jgi:hypothetical protein
MFRAVGDGPCRQAFRQVEARHADPVVGHPVIHVEAVRRAEIIAPVDSGGKHDVGVCPRRSCGDSGVSTGSGERYRI